MTHAAGERRGPRFDWTINLGHILTATMMLAAGFAAWSSTQATIQRQELRIERLESADEALAARIEAARQVTDTQRDRVVRLETYWEALQQRLSAIELKLDRALNRLTGGGEP